jgi:4'-phosphopantetheinyl transferase
MTATRVLSEPRCWERLLSEVHVWPLAARGMRSCATNARWLPVLSNEECLRYERLPAGSAKENYLAARILCRTTLSRYCDVSINEWRFDSGPYGKPTISSPGEFATLRFNLTHTDDLILCAVTRAGDIGVDVENTARAVDVSSMARHYFSPDEQARLAVLPPRRRAERFFEQWVLKEAYVKATGNGLGNSPERFTLERGSDWNSIAIEDCQFAINRPNSSHVSAADVILARQHEALSIKSF